MVAMRKKNACVPHNYVWKCVQREKGLHFATALIQFEFFHVSSVAIVLCCSGFASLSSFKGCTISSTTFCGAHVHTDVNAIVSS